MALAKAWSSEGHLLMTVAGLTREKSCQCGSFLALWECCLSSGAVFRSLKRSN